MSTPEELFAGVGKEVGTVVWTIDQFKLSRVPANQLGIFYSGRF
jgi:hypothetical protein